MSNNAVKKHHEPFIHIAKRDVMPGWKAWLIRLSAILIGLLLIGFFTVLLTDESFFGVYNTMYEGNFGVLHKGNFKMLWRFLQKMAILLCLSLAVTPAFKMKFWNCGAEGQALVGGLAAMICMIEIGENMTPWMLIAVVIISSIVAGAVWGLIPALFKAHFNTNETLFTLMMNYVATQLVASYVMYAGGNSKIINPVSTGTLPVIAGQSRLLIVIVVTVIMLAMFIYLKYSKHGYEISVVGESQNTARYIGINVKKVILRTMLVSGAVCGVAGMLVVSGVDHMINTNTMQGQGFTAIMVSWLGQFNPFIMAFMSALVIFLNVGAKKVSESAGLDPSYADIAVGIVVLLLVGCEFFIRYSVGFRKANKGGAE